MNLLFGDILAITTTDLGLSLIVLVVSAVSLGLTLRAQVLPTLHEEMAKGSRGRSPEPPNLVCDVAEDELR